MDYTTIRVSEEVADGLHELKRRGDSYDDVLRRLLNERDSEGAHSRAEPARERDQERQGDARDEREAPEERDHDLSERQAETLEIGQVLQGWRPGRNAEERQRRREVGEAALRWLRQRDEPASASEFKSELLPEHAIDEVNEDTWWRKVVREALQRARDQGHAEYSHGRHEWRWVE